MEVEVEVVSSAYATMVDASEETSDDDVSCVAELPLAPSGITFFRLNSVRCSTNDVSGAFAMPCSTGRIYDFKK